jgi:hypothetical protein
MITTEWSDRQTDRRNDISQTEQFKFRLIM